MLEGPITTHKTVNVTVVNGNLIQCGTKGGNLRLKSKTAGGQPLKVKWKWVGAPADQEFRLQFFALPLEDDPSETAPFWPFVEPVPPGGLTQLESEHNLTLQDINALCKYTVLVNHLHLDPVIIVEK